MSGRGGRHEKNDRMDAQLTKMWGQGILTELIARRVGYNHGSSVSHAAKRLGLTPRRDFRNTRGLQAVRIEKEAASLVKLEKAAKRAKPTGPIPTVFRCLTCGGRSDNPAGHSRCQTVAA